MYGRNTAMGILNIKKEKKQEQTRARAREYNRIMRRIRQSEITHRDRGRGPEAIPVHRTMTGR